MSIRVPWSLRVLYLAIACTLLAACGGPEVPLSGTITDAYTGKPIPSATIKLGWNTVTADAGGKYQLTQWNQKDILEITANGYEPLKIPLESQQQLAKPEPPVATLDTQIRPNTLSGVLKDSFTGQPLAGALVKASDTISATTGTDGSYTLTGLPESFDLTISAKDYAPLTEKISKTTALDTELRPNVVTGKVTDRYTNQPVASVAVKAGDATTTTGADGTYRLENVPADATLEISADGYADLSQPIEKTTAIDVVLRPDVLKGKLVDAATGEPIKFATIIAASSLTAPDATSVRMDNSADGSFGLEGVPEQGFVQVLAPGYKKAVIELKDGAVPSEIKLEPFQVKALYVTVGIGSNQEYLFDEYFSVIDKTELNAIVIDLKSDLRDDLGLVYYDSQAPMVKELGTSRDYMDLKAILAEAKKRNIYTIARIQLFSHDNVLADTKPEWAVKDRETGEVYADYPGPGIRYAYLDPTNKNVWEYNIQLGEEAGQLGFDEVNYDYIRFTDWYGDLSGFAERLEFSEPIDPKNDGEKLYQTIIGFLKEAHPRVNKSGAFLSADVFGRVVLKPSLPIGQDIARMAPYADYICPMIYPSLWWPGYLDLDNPTAHPYEVVLGSLEHSRPFFENVRAKNRPWIQDHTDPWQGSRVVKYGAEEVRAQLDATHDFDPTVGWMLYNSANIYTDAALKPE